MDGTAEPPPDAPGAASASSPDADEAPCARFVDAAARIGGRLVRDAVWTEEGCTWRLLRAQPGTAGAVPELAAGTLYGGAAGIALFLAELHHAAADPAVARTARGALEFALRHAASLPHTSFGLYGGRVGIAYAAVRAGLRLGLDLRAQAEAVLRPLAGNERRDTGVDVVSGAAGAIPALLWLSDHLDPALTLGMARGLGDHLVASAHRHPHGWFWGATPTATRGLCGFSHGASGMAHAFLELYHRTGDGEHRYAAEQALRYEHAFLSPQHGNWPDFRHKALAAQFAEGRLDALRARLRAGDAWPRQPASYPRYWCHGAPGIGLVRLRAYELLGLSRYRDEAWIAVQTTLASLAEPMSFSLCHGTAGNCDTLLMGAGVLQDPTLRHTARQAALRGIARYEDAGVPWPAGAAGGEPDPGLLLGEAGVGLFLLRLADSSVESVLLVTPRDGEPLLGGTGDAGYRLARARAIQEHVGNTLRRFAALGIDVDAVIQPRAQADAPPVCHVAAAHAAILTRVQGEPSAALRDVLDDAFAVERARYDLLTAPLDLAGEYVQSLARPSEDEVSWESARLALAPLTRVVDVRYDWDGWRPMASGTTPEPAERSHVLHRSGVHVAAQALTALSAAVLRTLTGPATLLQVTDAVARTLAGEPDSAQLHRLGAQVREQVVAAYRAGLITEVHPEAADESSSPPV